jgi:guanylate kinase
MDRGPLIIVSGPSGSGKTTVIRRLLAEESRPLRLSVSATTRPPRPGEVDGYDYHFWSKERFEEAIRAHAFVEWAMVHGSYYGTLHQEVEPFRQRGVGVILDVDVHGADQVRRKCPDHVSVFLQTSSPGAYEARLRQRGTETEATIQRRLATAERELARAGEYDEQVTNDDLDEAVAALRAIVARQWERGTHAG